MNEALDRKTFSRRQLLGYGLGTVGVSVVSPALLAACGGSQSTVAPTTTTGQTATTVSSGANGLLTAARSEGTVVAAAIGEPDSYYMPVIDAFEKFAGFKMDLPHPTYPASSQLDELKNARSLRDKAPYDVVEVTQSIADTAAGENLLEPYVSTRWVDIPSAFKDGDGKWSAAYFGLVSFIVNTDATKGAIPASWKDLRNSPLTPRRSFAMLGDPRTGQPFEGGLALLTVMSAALANNGSLDDVEPGLALLAELVEKKIFDIDEPSSLLALPDTVGEDATPINALFSFDAPLARAKAKGKAIKSVAPNDGLIGGFYPQAIPVNAPHPQAAKLWLEFIQSDEAAALFAANGAIPTRFQAIRSSGSKKLNELLPPDSELQAAIPSRAQIDAAQKVVDEKWTQYIPVKD